MAAKIYKSASFTRTFETNTRNYAITLAIAFLKTVDGVKGNRFTWRAEDESGFTVKVELGGEVKLMHKWNAARDKTGFNNRHED